MARSIETLEHEISKAVNKALAAPQKDRNILVNQIDILLHKYEIASGGKPYDLRRLFAYTSKPEPLGAQI